MKPNKIRLLAYKRDMQGGGIEMLKRSPCMPVKTLTLGDLQSRNGELESKNDAGR